MSKLHRTALYLLGLLLGGALGVLALFLFLAALPMMIVALLWLLVEEAIEAIAAPAVMIYLPTEDDDCPFDDGD